MTYKSIEMCTPELQTAYKLFKKQCDLAGLQFVITRTACDRFDQDLLFMQGRHTLEVVNSFRKQRGYLPITAAENIVVTWTLDSKHIIGEKRKLSEAFDIALIAHNKPHWDTKININNNEVPDYIEVANIGLSCGLIAGAFFKSKTTGKPTPDYCHFEI
jgi:hypothetical protein